MSLFSIGDRQGPLSRLKRSAGHVAAARAPRRLSADSARLAQPIPPLRPGDLPGPTIVLLNDCRDQDNLGAHCLVDGLIRVVSESVPQATIRPIPSHWLIDTSRGLGAFENAGAGLHQLRAVYPAVADEFDPIADLWMSGKAGPGADELLRRLEGADLVLLNGEGSVYRTNLSAIRELFLAWLCRSRLGIRTVFANATVHLTDVVPILPAMARRVLPVMDAVTLREPFSMRNLARYVPEVEARLIPDSAFAVTPADARDTPLTDLVRARIGDRPYFCFDPGPMPMDARPGFHSALYRLIMSLKGVCGDAVFVRTDPADRRIETVADETGSIYAGAKVDYREWMTLVRDAQFVLTGRYHNPILAAIMGCPSICLASSSHKVHGACEMLEHIGSPFDPTDLLCEAPAMVERGRGYADCRHDVGNLLEEICGRRRSETAELGSLVAGMVASAAPVPRRASVPVT